MRCTACNNIIDEEFLKLFEYDEELCEDCFAVAMNTAYPSDKFNRDLSKLIRAYSCTKKT